MTLSLLLRKETRIEKVLKVVEASHPAFSVKHCQGDVS